MRRRLGEFAPSDAAIERFRTDGEQQTREDKAAAHNLLSKLSKLPKDSDSVGAHKQAKAEILNALLTEWPASAKGDERLLKGLKGALQDLQKRGMTSTQARQLSDKLVHCGKLLQDALNRGTVPIDSPVVIRWTQIDTLLSAFSKGTARLAEPAAALKPAPDASASALDSAAVSVQNATAVLSAEDARDWANQFKNKGTDFETTLRHFLDPLKTGKRMEDLLAGQHQEKVRSAVEATLEQLAEKVKVEHGIQARARIDATLEALQVKVNGQIPNDGHCLYHALQFAQDHPFSDHPSVKSAQNMRHALLLHFNELEKSKEIHKILGCEPSQTHHLKKRLEAGLFEQTLGSEGWGGPEEIRLFAHLTGHPVVLVHSDSATIFHPGKNDLNIEDTVVDLPDALDLLKENWAERPLIIVNRHDAHFEPAVKA